MDREEFYRLKKVQEKKQEAAAAAEAEEKVDLAKAEGITDDVGVQRDVENFDVRADAKGNVLTETEDDVIF